jgi:hypothetical protein
MQPSDRNVDSFSSNGATSKVPAFRSSSDQSYRSSSTCIGARHRPATPCERMTLSPRKNGSSLDFQNVHNLSRGRHTETTDAHASRPNDKRGVGMARFRVVQRLRQIVDLSSLPQRCYSAEVSHGEPNLKKAASTTEDSVPDLVRGLKSWSRHGPAAVLRPPLPVVDRLCDLRRSRSRRC